MKKRILGFFLALATLLSLLPLSALALPVINDNTVDPEMLNKFSDHYPKPDIDNDTVTFSGGWTIGRYVFASAQLELYSHLAIAQYGLMGAEEVSNVWTNGGGFYNGAKTLALPSLYQDWAVPSIRYTAPTNGKISYTLDKMMPSAKKDIAVALDFVLLKNGEQIWPAAGTRYEFVGPNSEGLTNMLDVFLANANFPSEITVSQGDTLDLLVFTKAGGVEQAVISPAVKYTELADTPVIQSPSVDLGKDLGLAVPVWMDPAKSRDDAKIGLLCWTGDSDVPPANAVRLTESTSLGSNTVLFVYDGLTAKQMTDEVNFMPYTYVDGSDIVYYGAKVTTSIAASAEAAYATAPAALKEALRELVNYGTNAQYAFDYNTDRLANEFLSDDEKTSGRKTGTDVWAQSADGTTGVNITLASLLLDQKIGVKLVAPKVSGVSSYTLEYATKADFSDKAAVAMTATEDGAAMRGIFYIDTLDVTKTYYIRVTDGNGYGNTLTYSVESYVTRIVDTDINDTEYNLVHSLLAYAYAVKDLMAS